MVVVVMMVAVVVVVVVVVVSMMVLVVLVVVVLAVVVAESREITPRLSTELEDNKLFEMCVVCEVFYVKCCVGRWQLNSRSAESLSPLAPNSSPAQKNELESIPNLA